MKQPTPSPCSCAVDCLSVGKLRLGGAILKLCFALAVALASTQASATAEFICMAMTPQGKVWLGARVDSAPEPLFPLANPQLNLFGKVVLLANASQTNEAGWATVRDARSGHLVIAYRKSGGVPDFPPGMKHPLCDATNWAESCWGAELKIRDPVGKLKVLAAIYGIG